RRVLRFTPLRARIAAKGTISHHREDQLVAAIPAFQNICSKTAGFNIRPQKSRRGSPYPGMVVASRDALYFVVNRARIRESAAAVGGATGGLLAGLLS